jgi:hypothetical protein
LHAIGSGCASEIIGGIKTLVAMEAQKAAQAQIKAKLASPNPSGAPGEVTSAGELGAGVGAGMTASGKDKRDQNSTAGESKRDAEEKLHGYGFK